MDSLPGYMRDLITHQLIGFQLQANNYTPPKMPNIYMYEVEGYGTMMFEYTIDLDKEYYKMINRDSKLKELGI